MTTTVNDIEHIESQCYSGVAVTRVYFQPNAKIEVALSQITAISQTLLRIFRRALRRRTSLNTKLN